MALLDFIGGLAGGYNAIQGGINQAKDREWVDEQRQMQRDNAAYRNEQQAYQRTQWAENLDQQKRARTLREANAAVPTTETVDLSKGAPELAGPTFAEEGGQRVQGQGLMPAPDRQQRTMPEHLRMRRFAYNAQAAGDTETYRAYMQAADKLQHEDAAKKFYALQQSTDGMSPLQIVQAAADIYNGDPSAGYVDQIRDLGPNRVAARITNRDTGEAQDVEFNDPQKLLGYLHSYYSPDSYAALAAENRKRQAKLDEIRATELAKPLKADVGEKLIPGVNDPRGGIDLTGVYLDGKAIGASGTGGSRTGTGTRGSGKAAAGPMSEEDRAYASLDTSIKAKNSQLTDVEYRAIKDNIRALLQQNPRMKGETAARIAGLANEEGGKALYPGVDTHTGRIGWLYDDKTDNDTYIVRGGIAGADNIPLNAEGKPVLGPKELQAGADGVVKRLNATQPGLGNLYHRAAFSQSALDELRDQTMRDIVRGVSRSPNWKNLTREQQQAWVLQTFEERIEPDMETRLDLIRRVLKDPAASGGPGLYATRR